ncbi:hypothetical protein GFM13_29070 [Rhizobium leguminosarum bv. viciae]|nr:hypothetical protein [Rhizobium leguminosarum bv. viciae]
MRSGDTPMVTRIDRLARAIGDLHDIVRKLRAKGIALRATEQPIAKALGIRRASVYRVLEDTGKLTRCRPRAFQVLTEAYPALAK